MESTRSSLVTISLTQRVRAFTLIEMLVVLAIITVVTTVTLVGHSSFDRSMLLTDATYSVALAAREMQTYGLSSRVTGGYTNIGYGLYVSANSPTSYLTYGDTQRVTSVPACLALTGSDSSSPDYKRGNCMYETTAPADTIVETSTFARGFRITKFCGKSGATTYCSTDASSPLTALDVVFMRPNTDAVVTGRRSTGSPLSLSSAAIYVSTADNVATRAVCITQIGQIYVSATACP